MAPLLLEVQQPQSQMVGGDHVVTELSRFVVAEGQRPAGSVRESLEHAVS